MNHQPKKVRLDRADLLKIIRVELSKAGTLQTQLPGDKLAKLCKAERFELFESELSHDELFD